jgi:hypothetical protein
LDLENFDVAITNFGLEKTLLNPETEELIRAQEGNFYLILAQYTRPDQSSLFLF